MKTFRAHTSFIPESVKLRLTRELPAVILPKTDYEIMDTNQAFGLYVKVYVSAEDKTKDNFQKVYISPEEISQYGEVLQKLKIEDIRRILDSIKFAPSCVDFNWRWEIVEVDGIGWNNIENQKESVPLRGFLINTTFQRPDTNTGVFGTGKGRRMWIEDTASETSVVMTAWVCVELIVKHELMEGFLYGNAKILDPHKTLDELAHPMKIQR